MVSIIHVLCCGSSPHLWAIQIAIFKILCNHLTFIMHHTHLHTTLHTECDIKLSTLEHFLTVQFSKQTSKIRRQLYSGQNLHSPTLRFAFEFSFSGLNFMIFFQSMLQLHAFLSRKCLVLVMLKAFNEQSHMFVFHPTVNLNLRLYLFILVDFFTSVVLCVFVSANNDSL